MKKFFVSCFVLLSVYICVEAAKIKEYHLNVGQFDKVSITDNINVVYQNREDSTGFINYSCDAALADALIVSNSKGKLKIQVQTEDVNLAQLPTVYIYSDFLTEVENSSDSTFRALSVAPCSKFEARQIGNGSISVDGIKSTDVKAIIATGHGTISLTGKCTNANLNMVGAGVIQTDLLEAYTVTCKILGSGTIGCSPKESLKVQGIGSTKIYYRGNPVIKKSGGGKLIKIDE